MRKFLLFLCAFLLAAQIADCQTVIYSQEEFKLKATICKPVGNGPFPAVIYHHGGVGNIVGGAPEETCRALADKGFVGFSPIRRPTKSLKGHMESFARLTHTFDFNIIEKFFRFRTQKKSFLPKSKPFLKIFD